MEAPAPPESGKRKAVGPEPPAPTSLAGSGLDCAICRICQNYLTDPVTIDCGHNFCRACITQRWEGEETPSCPQCGETVQKRALRINVDLGSLVQTIKQMGLNPGQKKREEGNVCAEHGKELIWFCKEDDKSLCADFKGSPARRSLAVIPMAEATHKYKEEKSTSNRSEDGNVQGQEAISTQRQEFGVDVTLDPDTANPELVLSADRKRVRLGDTRQDLPDNPERFDLCHSVLGAEGFPGGRHYWEVQVGAKTRWAVGVCRESVRRKGQVTLSPGNGYWAVWLRDGEYKALTSPATPLPVTVRPRQVGIFLDYEAGKVSFYNVTGRSWLFTFTDTFSGTLRPYFNPGRNAGGKNAAPLISCPVSAQARGNLCP